jgi:putative peptide zinc metalloprotease protein
MTESLYSQSWYRVAGLKPRLRSHARVHRHDYRDEVWYVLEDSSSGRFHRFSAAANYLIGLMDGERTVQQIWDAAVARLGDDAPTQDETIRLLGQMHGADVLVCDLPPDSREIFQRREQHQQRQWRQRLAQPLAVRIPLFDPDPFLTRWMPLVRPLFGWFGVLLWLAVVVTGGVLAVSHWPELTHNLADRVLATDNLLMLWLAYPLVKAVHELGHGFVVKHYGGEVREIGIMLLVLMPVPYVEASSASAFREKHKRALVGAAGILVELFLAGAATILWINAEPGLVRAFAFNVMLIGGVSTLLFNGNPLLRFDGYYVLSDLIEVPNLATRANRYLGYLAQRWLFGLREAEAPQMARGEPVWMVFYGVASFGYRMFITFWIALFIAGEFFVIGALLAVWAVAMQVVWPLVKGLTFVLNSPRLNRQRVRAVLATAGGVATLAAFLGLVPLPSWTRAEGVVWLPEQSQVRAQADGLVVRLLAEPGSRVAPGDPLIETDDPFLVQQVRLLEARRRELDARLTEAQLRDRSQAQVVREEITVVEADLARAEERLDALVMRSGAAGRFVVPDAEDLPGRFLRRGEVVAYVTDPAAADVRVVVEQDDIGLVRNRTESVQLRLDDWQSEPVDSRILRQVPAATQHLPAEALGTGGGGAIPLDPRDGNGLTALDKVFVLDVELPAAAATDYLGRRVQVRFDHGAEPLAAQWYRSLRQLFLSHFGV